MLFSDFEREELEEALTCYRYVKILGVGTYGKVYLVA